jgi:hypothetical protein
LPERLKSAVLDMSCEVESGFGRLNPPTFGECLLPASATVSAPGTSRHFAATQHSSRFRGDADIKQARLAELDI